MPPRKGKKGRGKAEVGEKTSPAGPPTKPAAPLDILILAGQSNIAGRGELRADDAWPRGDVARFSAAGLWEPAKDPLHADVDLRKAAQCGVGPALACVDALRARGGALVLLGELPREGRIRQFLAVPVVRRRHGRRVARRLVVRLALSIGRRRLVDGDGRWSDGVVIRVELGG